MTQWLEPAEAMVRIHKALGRAQTAAPEGAEVTIHMHPDQFETLVRHYASVSLSDPVPFPVNEPPVDYDFFDHPLGDPQWKIFGFRVVPEPEMFPRIEIRVRTEIKA